MNEVGLSSNSSFFNWVASAAYFNHTRKGMSSGLFNAWTDSGAGPRSSTLSCPQLSCASVLHREKSTRKMKRPRLLCSGDDVRGMVVVADLCPIL
jgi:hypothetical protein